MPYATFAGTLWPVAVAGFALVIALIVLFFPAEFWTRERIRAEPQSTRVHQPLLIKSLLVMFVMVAAYFAGQTPAKVALIAGAILLVTRRIKSEKVYQQVDWPLLLIFMGLFIVVAGFEKVVLTPDAIALVGRLHLDQPYVLTIVTATLSNLVSKVPAVLVLKPFVVNLPDPQHAWLVVAMSSTLARNFMLVGPVANLIVVQIARAHGVRIQFWDYAKVGAPLTIVTLVIGVVLLGLFR